MAFCGRCHVVTTLTRALLDLVAQLARPTGRTAWRADLAIVPRALRWALPWAILGRISRNASPLRWVEHWAKVRPDVIAIEDTSRKLNYAELYERSRRCGAALAAEGVNSGDRVVLLMPSSTELVVALLACWSIGAVPCPLDPELPETILRDVLMRFEAKWSVGNAMHVTPPKTRQIQLLPGALTSLQAPARLASVELALVLPTSGSEGSVKLCKITAGRLALSGHAFGALALDCRCGDLIYCPLPLQHATAITVALMPALVHGVTLHLAGKFSASRFWDVVSASRATQLLYVGDLLRFALPALVNEAVSLPRLRRAIGNGLDEVTWRTLTKRLPSLGIIEFYGATEAPSALLNFSGKLGSIGHLPLRRLSRYVVVRHSGDKPEATWARCAPGEIGELWIRIPRGKRPWLGDFEGYLAPKDERRAVIANVFSSGDRFYRTGDLVRYDADDYLYFVDRIGDVWRNMGHNVSTLWLANELRAVDGICDALVVPVALDDSIRRFGLAVVVTSHPGWRIALESKLCELPSYARPQLVQVVRELPRTATHKPNKSQWRFQLWAPSGDGASEAYVWRDGLKVANHANWQQRACELLTPNVQPAGQHGQI